MRRLVLVAVLLGGCAPVREPCSVAPVDDEYAVWDAVTRELAGASRPLRVLESPARCNERCAPGVVPEEFVEGFNRCVGRVDPLEQARLPPGLALISAADAEGALGEALLRGNASEFPGARGIYRVSRVSFDADTGALAFVHYVELPSDGSGRRAVAVGGAARLQLAAEGWRVVEWLSRWMT